MKLAEVVTQYEKEAKIATEKLLLGLSAPDWWGVRPSHCLTLAQQLGLRRLLGIQGIVGREEIETIADYIKWWPVAQSDESLIGTLSNCMNQKALAVAGLYKTTSDDPGEVLQVVAVLVNMATASQDANNSLFILNHLVYQWWSKQSLPGFVREHIDMQFTGVRYVTNLRPMDPMLFRRVYCDLKLAAE